MVFDWLFKKKKSSSTDQGNSKNQQSSQLQKQPSNTTGGAPAATSTAQQKTDHGKDKKETQIDESQIWIYEYLLQYLTSPLWKVPIYEFLDENCIIFDDEEENKFSYTDAHNKFKSLIEGMIGQLLEDIGINEQLLLQFVEIGLKSSHHKKIFEQLLIVDNFLVFKKLMVKRNKELELEALKEIMKQDKESKPEDEEKLKLASLEAERADVEHAIQMSKAAEEEMQKMQEMEDLELQKVLELSKASFQNEEDDRKKVEDMKMQSKQENEERLKKVELAKKQEEAREVARRQELFAQEQARIQAEEQARKEAEEQARVLAEQSAIAKKAEEEERIRRELAEQERKKREEEEKLRRAEEMKAKTAEEKRLAAEEQKKREAEEERQRILEEERRAKYEEDKKKKVEEEKKKIFSQITSSKKDFKGVDKAPQMKQISSLPPLIDRKFEKPMEDLLLDREQIVQQLDSYKSVEERLRNQQLPEKQEDPNKQESVEERKKRLLAQRELLRKKKQQEREKELKNYQESGIEGKKTLASQETVLLMDQNAQGEQLTAEELQHRQALMQKIKKNI